MMGGDGFTEFCVFCLAFSHVVPFCHTPPTTANFHFANWLGSRTGDHSYHFKTASPSQKIRRGGNKGLDQ
jgi:hypothetical protein